MSELSIGTLYESNQKLVAKYDKPLTKEEIETKKSDIADFIAKKSNKYYMLLCNERKDYTVLVNHSNNATAIEKMTNEVIVCLQERGPIVAIDTKDGGVELWIVRSNLAHMYALFPYDAAVIEC